MAEESKLQTKILKDLRSMRRYCECFKIMKCSDDGVPDIFFTTVASGGVYIECKATNGVKGPMQIIKVKKLNKCGSLAYFCFSWEDWIEIKKAVGIYDMNNVVSRHIEREHMLSQR